MIVRETKLSGVKIIEPKVFGDSRGYFMEVFSKDRYQKEAGISDIFVQDNLSNSKKGTLRGLHYQLKHHQGKLVSVVQGEVLDVAVDIRKGSKTFGQWESVILNDQNHWQFYIPPGFAHGFYVLSDDAIFAYKCTDYYDPRDSYGICWNDESIAIDWSLTARTTPILSEKDQQLSRLKDIFPSQLPE